MEIPYDKEDTFEQLQTIIKENKKWGINILLSKNALAQITKEKNFTTLSSENSLTIFIKGNDDKLKEKIILLKVSKYLFALKKITLNNEIIYDVQNTKRPKTIMIS